MIDWAYEIAWFFGGAFFINALPHLIAGVMGEPHRTPFALMRRRTVSSARVNVFWAALNLAVAWALLARIGTFDPWSTRGAAALGLGSLLMGLHLSRGTGVAKDGEPPA